MPTIKWIPVSRKPKPNSKKNKIKLVNVYWWNKLDSGDYNDFAYWSEEEQKWFHFDKSRTEVEARGPYMNRIVTHWSEQPESPKHPFLPWKSESASSRSTGAIRSRHGTQGPNRFGKRLYSRWIVGTRRERGRIGARTAL